MDARLVLQSRSLDANPGFASRIRTQCGSACRANHIVPFWIGPMCTIKSTGHLVVSSTHYPISRPASRFSFVSFLLYVIVWLLTQISFALYEVAFVVIHCSNSLSHCASSPTS